jgi:hypothetical protein
MERGIGGPDDALGEAGLVLRQGLDEVFQNAIEFLWVVGKQGVAVAVEAFKAKLVTGPGSAGPALRLCGPSHVWIEVPQR